MNDYSTKTCLFLGRFQPFHIGHLMVVQGMVKSCESVIIGVGSSNHAETRDNPFSYDERREMIQRALQAVDLIPQYDIAIMPVPDIAEDSKWVAHVTGAVGKFDAVWTGNKNVAELFRAAGVEVKEIKEVPGIGATEIRKMMIDENALWDEKVPDDVAAYIKSIGGAERVRNLG